MRLALLLALALVGGDDTAVAVPAFDLQGHRGARGLAPENTLAGFARALGLGVSTLELDLAVTRDGVVVVSHDPVLNPDLARGPDGAWLEGPRPSVIALSRAELAKYDVGRLRPGSPYARQFPDQVPVDGARIPTLAEVFALARRAGNGEVRFNVETKVDPRRPSLTPAPEAFADAVLAVVNDAGMASRVLIQSFDWRSLRRVQQKAPGIETVCLTTEEAGGEQLQRGRRGASAWLGGLDPDDYGGSVPRLVQAAGCRTWSPRHRDLAADARAEAHRLGLRVVPLTVNEPADMKALVDLGVDGLITDRPDLLRRVMEEKGLPLPRATPVAP